jgi:hypothetical protein
MGHAVASHKKSSTYSKTPISAGTKKPAQPMPKQVPVLRRLALAAFI